MNPLVKVPILVSTAYINYACWNFPNAPAAADRKRRETADPITRILSLTALTVKLTMTAICGFALVEAVVIIAQSFPGLLSQRILSILAPKAASHPLPLLLSPYSALGFLLILSGGLFRLWAMRTLGQFFVMEVSLQKDHRLVKSGPYALVRHPSYVGYMFVIFGDVLLLLGGGSYLSAIGVWQSRLWGALACLVAGRSLFVATVLMPSRAGREDAVLREEFGTEWEAWARQTPYKLIPYVF
ncbi:Isoprenylcysteine carboxyl methyltransferase family-domain-containing protein [Dichomitus squalens]|nr:Isoprenylcysteine carboxyl methyltransferase family-domain-containing protein [Dichomitus squalens]